MAKYLVIPAVQSEDMYGYSAIIVALTESNLTEIKRLQWAFSETKNIDPSIGSVTYFLPRLDIDILTDNFEDYDKENSSVIELDDAELEELKDNEECDYKVESPYIMVGDFGIKVIYSSKYTSDEVSGDFSFASILTKL